jgi:hypothetical protein
MEGVSGALCPPHCDIITYRSHAMFVQYSGKYRRHCLKFTVACSHAGEPVLLLGPFVGARHDRSCWNSDGVESHWWWIGDLVRADLLLLRSIFHSAISCFLTLT